MKAFKREFKPLVNLLNDVLRSVRELSDDTYNVDVTGLYNRLKLLTAIDKKVKCTCSSKYLSMANTNTVGFSICTPITYDTDITIHFYFRPDKYTYSLEVESGEDTVWANDVKGYSEGFELF